tara:strand:+ start:29064 stop:29747 length:684 start_codon:yes stop_codon:yes gene_type:complete
MTSYPHRKIRSFVRREGRITKGQQRALDELLPVYGLQLSAGLIDTANVFENDHPCTLEIGFGNGHALLEMAAKNPDNNYIGIEVHRPGVGNLLLGIEEQGLTNIRVFNDDAVEVLKQCIPNESLDRVLLFFPDPWHKKRHHKRRILQTGFVNAIQQKLKSGGIFHMATDWENYAEHMMDLMTARDDFNNQAGQCNYTERPDYRPLTKFEQRGIRLGHGVWDLMFIRM